MTDKFPDYEIHRQRLMDAFTQSDKIKKITVPKGSTYNLSDEIC